MNREKVEIVNQAHALTVAIEMDYDAGANGIDIACAVGSAMLALGYAPSVIAEAFRYWADEHEPEPPE